MSTSAELTAQIGTAVAELNNAKNRFEAIREETEQKVRAATEAVPGILSLTLFVNASSGSDETGTGSSSMPFKTIKRAIDGTVNGCRLVVRLEGSSAAVRHVIDSTIYVRSRIVDIVYSKQHIEFAESLNSVFSCDMGAHVYFSDFGGGSGYIYSVGNKTMFNAAGKTVVSIGGYATLVIYIDADSTFKFLSSKYSNSRAFHEISMGRVSCRKSDAAVENDPTVIVYSPDLAGFALYDPWDVSLGSNAVDTDQGGSVVLLGSAKLIGV